MKGLWRLVILCLFVLMGLSACRGEESAVRTPEPPSDTSDTSEQANLESLLDNAFVVRAAARTPVPAPRTAPVHVGDGVDVDEQGRAILRFGDLITADITRDGELRIQQLSADEQSAIANFVLVAGAALFDFNPDEALQERILIVESEFENGQIAVVQATGTRFLVVREEEAPLGWVIGLDAAEDDLSITADGVTKPVPAGTARWVAPVGEPSPGIQADMRAVEEWLRKVRTGQPAREVGEVLWSFADVTSNLTSLETLPSPGEPFFVEGVQLTLHESGTYALEDCNRDGNNDVVIQNGMVTFDFRSVLARVESLDVTILNRAEPHTGELVVFDPAYEEIARVFVQSGAGQVEVLSSRSPTPYHYASLSLKHGCFLGFSLTPPTPDGEPAPPRSAEQLKPFCETRVALRLRAAPRLDADIITTLPPSTPFEPLERLANERWLFVVAEAQAKGWILGDPEYIACVGYELQALPTRQPPPTITPTITPTPLPDLAISLDDFAQTCNGYECQVTVYARLFNTGETSLYEVEVQVSADPDAFLSTYIKELPPSPKGLFWEFVLPSTKGGCYDPDCTICLVIDPYDDIAEENEENNKICQTWQ